jgi:hypothetical protein
MNKKKYVAPELELLLLEQSDIITASGGTIGGDGGEEDEFGDWT